MCMDCTRVCHTIGHRHRRGWDVLRCCRTAERYRSACKRWDGFVLPDSSKVAWLVRVLRRHFQHQALLRGVSCEDANSVTADRGNKKGKAAPFRGVACRIAPGTCMGSVC